MGEKILTGMPTPKETILSATEQKELQKKLNDLTEEIFSMTPGMLIPERITKEKFQELPIEERSKYEKTEEEAIGGDIVYEYNGDDANKLFNKNGNKNENNQLSNQESFDYFNSAKSCADMIVGGEVFSEIPKETNEQYVKSEDMTISSHDSYDKNPIGTIEYNGKKFDIFRGESWKTNTQFSDSYDNQVDLIVVEKK